MDSWKKTNVHKVVPFVFFRVDLDQEKCPKGRTLETYFSKISFKSFEMRAKVVPFDFFLNQARKSVHYKGVHYNECPL